MQSVLNVRMDSVLKERGDKVLSENGISVSEAVRALWSQLATTRTLPDFLRYAEEQEQARQKKRDALDALALSEARLPKAISEISSYESLKEELYKDMWAEYEALE